VEGDERILGREAPSPAFTVRIGKPIEPAETALIRHSGTPEAFDKLVRGIWLENLPTDESTLMGQFRHAFVTDHVRSLLGGAKCIEERIGGLR
jgi:hypothetical protein